MAIVGIVKVFSCCTFGRGWGGKWVFGDVLCLTGVRSVGF